MLGTRRNRSSRTRSNSQLRNTGFFENDEISHEAQKMFDMPLIFNPESKGWETEGNSSSTSITSSESSESSSKSVDVDASAHTNSESFSVYNSRKFTPSPLSLQAASVIKQRRSGVKKISYTPRQTPIRSGIKATENETMIEKDTEANLVSKVKVPPTVMKYMSKCGTQACSVDFDSAREREKSHFDSNADLARKVRLMRKKNGHFQQSNVDDKGHSRTRAELSDGSFRPHSTILQSARERKLIKVKALAMRSRRRSSVESVDGNERDSRDVTQPYDANKMFDFLGCYEHEDTQRVKQETKAIPVDERLMSRYTTSSSQDVPPPKSSSVSPRSRRKLRGSTGDLASSERRGNNAQENEMKSSNAGENVSYRRAGLVRARSSSNALSPQK